MKLIECHIENFGTLSSKNYFFSEGLNPFLDNNGSGKTTLSYFIKAMFYGLSSASRNVADNDRKKFTPWGGGVFGGSLTFSENGKTYRIERSFGKTPKDDSFKLIDLQSEKISRDYSENIGQELFGINSHAYIKSAYYSKDIPKERKEDGVESITARLNGIIDDTDIENYKNAEKKLDARRRDYEKSEKAQISARDGLEKRFVIRKEREEELAACKIKLSEQLLKLESAEADAKKLEDLYTSAIALEGKKDTYSRLLKEVSEKKEGLTDISDFFGGKLPDTDKISELEKKYSEFSALQQTINAAGSPICREVSDFEENFPSIPEISKLKELREEHISALLEKKRLGETLKAGYDFNTAAPLLNDADYSEISRAISEREKAKANTESASAALAERKGAPLPLIAGCVISLIAAVVGGVLWMQESKPGIVIAALGAVMFLIFAALSLSRVFGASKEKKELESRYENAQKAIKKYNSILMSYEARLGIRIESERDLAEFCVRAESSKAAEARLKEQRESLKNAGKRLERAEIAVKDYFSSLRRADIGCAELEGVISELESYLRLREEAKRLISEGKLANQTLKNHRAEIAAFLSSYDFEKGIGTAECFQKLRAGISEHGSLKSGLEKAEKELSSFISENPGYQSFDTDGQQVADISSRREENKKLVSSLREETSRLGVNIEKLTETVDSEASLEEEIESAEGELCRIRYRLRVINRTMELLERAKEELSVRYIGSIRKSFKEHLALLADSDFPTPAVDSELKISLLGQGMTRESGYFSSGIKDLLELTMHLSLSEALFEGRESFIILDDPFANLDKGNLTRALDFLSKLSESSQVIYFTCHESRLPQKETHMTL